jgi:hypothetical protein
VIKEVFGEMNPKIRNIKYTFQPVIWNYESKNRNLEDMNNLIKSSYHSPFVKNGRPSSGAAKSIVSPMAVKNIELSLSKIT